MAAQRQATNQPKTIRLPLMGAYSNRGYNPDKDQRFVNMFPETRKVDQLENTKIFINKRPGLTLYRDYGTGEGRGAIYFNGKFYVAVGNKVYEDAVSPVAKITLTGSTGHIAMAVANSSTIGDYLFVCDGTSGWIINSAGTVTQITDADFPSPHVPSIVFIDGYIILPKANSVDVYNCDLDTPTSWSADNFLSAEMFPDYVTALARQNNQVVVLGPTSIEFFYDAANAAGSPLSRNDSTTIQFGVAAPNAVYQNEKYCIVTAQSDSGGRGVWLIEGFQPRKVSDEYIDRIIDAETSISTAVGFGIRAKGHLFYVLNLPTVGRTLVYDVDEKLWHEWSSNSAGSHAVFQCNHMADNGTGSAYLLHNSNGCLYKFDPNANTDAATAILCELVTNRYDMDTMARKFMHNAKIVGDRYTSNSVSLSWSDNDYVSWSNTKTISLSDDYPAFQRLGAFRRRAFRIQHSSDNPLRLESLEVTYTEGEY